VRQIYQLTFDPYEEGFANAVCRGTILEKTRCPECGSSRNELTSPLVIEWIVDKWENGSDVIGDFTWPCMSEVLVVTQRVRELLESRFSGFSFGPVSMIQDPKLKPSKRKNARAKSRVCLPYSGPPLWELRVASECSLDLPRSGRKIAWECKTCGRRKWEIVRGSQLVVDPTTWAGTDVFSIREMGRLAFVTDPVRAALVEAQVTNVRMEQRGIIWTD
jgi:hypothetical protein